MARTQIYQQLEDFTKMIQMTQINGMIVTGSSGIGKTSTVRRTLRYMQVDYAYDKVVTKSKGDLYKILHNNNNKVLIIDEANEMIKKGSPFLPILLSALEAGENRRITYFNKRDKDIQSGRYPQSFEYTGSMIFITNMSLARVDQAILSRSLTMEIVLNKQEILREIREGIEEYHPKIPVHLKREVYKFLVDNQHRIEDLDYRKYEQILCMRVGTSKNWKKYADEMVIKKNDKWWGIDLS
jgi:hypothetical protein